MEEFRARQRHRIIEVTAAFLQSGKGVTALGSLISSLSFLTAALKDRSDPLPVAIEEELATLEEIYGVALDREWQELPSEELQFVLTAVELIKDRAGGKT